MSVTPDSVPHGLEGYKKWKCKCSVCRAANAKAVKDNRAKAKANDELAARRSGRRTTAAKRRSESKDSVVGDMERAVVEECAALTNSKATLVVAAKALARSVDMLRNDEKAIALYNSTIKQLMATMAELRGDKLDARTANKRKSGGRLATVGNLTKVRRAQ